MFTRVSTIAIAGVIGMSAAPIRGASIPYAEPPAAGPLDGAVSLSQIEAEPVPVGTTAEFEPLAVRPPDRPRGPRGPDRIGPAGRAKPPRGPRLRRQSARKPPARAESPPERLRQRRGRNSRGPRGQLAPAGRRRAPGPNARGGPEARLGPPMQAGPMARRGPNSDFAQAVRRQVMKAVRQAMREKRAQMMPELRRMIQRTVSEAVRDALSAGAPDSRGPRRRGALRQRGDGRSSPLGGPAGVRGRTGGARQQGLDAPQRRGRFGPAPSAAPRGRANRTDRAGPSGRRGQRRGLQRESGRLSNRFDRIDANGDGVIDRDEFPGPAEGYKRLDSNRDGVIDRQEAQAAGRGGQGQGRGRRGIFRTGPPAGPDSMPARRPTPPRGRSRQL